MPETITKILFRFLKKGAIGQIHSTGQDFVKTQEKRILTRRLHGDNEFKSNAVLLENGQHIWIEEGELILVSVQYTQGTNYD